MHPLDEWAEANGWGKQTDDAPNLKPGAVLHWFTLYRDYLRENGASAADAQNMAATLTHALFSMR